VRCSAAALARRLSFGQAIGLSVAVRATCIPLFLLCPGPLSLGAVYALASLFGPLYDVVQFSYRISLIPDALQGRVNSSFRLFAFLLNPVGAAACGWLLEHGGSGLGGGRLRRRLRHDGGGRAARSGGVAGASSGYGMR
jgi:hypothetical protein